MRRFLALTIAVTVTATPLAARPPEEAVLAEVAVGLVASFAGMYAGWSISELLADSFPDNPALARQLRMASIFGGIVLGASGGVALTGTLLGVNGNIPLCFLGGVLGIAVGALASIPIYALTDIDIDLLLIPAATVGLAVWGFNHGATSR